MEDQFVNQSNIMNKILNVTECFIQFLSENAIQCFYYNGKKKKHTIKYEIRIHLQSDKIVWLNGGIPGSAHDLTIVQNYGLLSNLFPGEFILSDKAYIRETCFYHPIKHATTAEKKTIQFSN